MALHLAAGDRAGALTAFEACRATLEQELGVSPAPETEALAERIRSTEPNAQPGTRRSGHGLQRSGALLEGPLVGRSDEFSKLVELSHAARQGRAQVVVLSGEAGIGKTRLAKEFLVWAAANGADVLEGRAFETGGRLPFQPLVDALRPRLERENAPEDLLSDVWLTELGRVLPELRERYPDLPVAAGDEVAARTRLFEAIARLGLALALRSPVVLLVDDVQWADAGSLDVLRYASRRWSEAGAPLVLLLGVRAESLADTPALSDWLAGLRRDVALSQLQLGPITAADTVHLVAGFGAGRRPAATSEQTSLELDRLASWLFAESGGHPFFAVQIIRELLERGVLALHLRDNGEWEIDSAAIADQTRLGAVLPPGVLDVVRARLARLGRAARELLSAAAVLGQGFTFDQVCRVAGLTEDEALMAIDALVRGYLLRLGSDGSYSFSHDKLREVAYVEAGDARQRVFHRRALDALGATASAAELARHAVAAGLDDAICRYSIEAGDEAMQLLAARDALPHYERASDIALRQMNTALVADLHARRGKAYVSMAQWPDARREFQLVLDELTSAEPEVAERRAEVLVALLEVCWWLLDLPSLRAWAQEAHALAASLGRGDLETLASGWLAAALGADGDVSGCVDQSERALARGAELGVPPPAPVYTYMSLSLYWLGRLDEAVERGDEGVRAARQANNTTATMFSLPHLGLALAGAGRYGEALDVFAEARRFGREYGVHTLLARSISISAGFHLDLGDFLTNEALAEEARELARSLNFAPPAVSSGIDLLLNFARRGEVARAEALVGEVAGAVDKASGWHGWLWSLRLSQARAEIAVARADWDEALRWTADAIERSRARQRLKYEVLGLMTRAHVLGALGRSRDAATELRRAVALARTVADPALLVRASAALLLVDGDDALVADASRALQQIADAMPAPDMRERFLATEPARVVARLHAR
jgi:tetratricopeptide (TPR) repeat protein